MGKKILVTVIASLLTASSICLAGNVYAQPKEVTWKIYLMYRNLLFNLFIINKVELRNKIKRQKQV